MAILEREPFCHPAALFDLDFDGNSSSLERENADENACTEDGAAESLAWWVLHTKPRAEKALSRRLFQRGRSYFLPQFRRERIVQRRRVKSFLPLFPGYVFVQGEAAVREALVGTSFVVNCLPVPDQAQLVRDLRQIHELMTRDAPLAPEERLEVGMPAEIVEGPFAGHTGRVVHRNGRTRLVVAVNFLQGATSVEVEPSHVRPL